MKPEEAAKYMLVAWKKDWKMSLYLQTITGVKAEPPWEFDEILKPFPWMPLKYFWRSTVRRFMADNYPAFNDLLWSAKDNEALFKLAPVLMLLRDADWDNRGKNKMQREVTNAFKYAQLSLQRRHLEEKISVAKMRGGNGHSWGIVK
jgi:hypothetical protein